jgi:four helix bundle protein
MEDKAQELSARLLDYGAEIVKLCVHLNKSIVGRHIGIQLLRSGTSVGANYEEARGAQSRADFIHKLQIVLKEIRESLYWIRLIKKAELVESNKADEIIDETTQLSKIIAKSLITVKQSS